MRRLSMAAAALCAVLWLPGCAHSRGALLAAARAAPCQLPLALSPRSDAAGHSSAHARHSAGRRSLAARQPQGPLRVFAYGTDHTKLVDQARPTRLGAQARSCARAAPDARPGPGQVASVTWSQNAHNPMNYRQAAAATAGISSTQPAKSRHSHDNWLACSILGAHGQAFDQWHSKFRLLLAPLQSLPEDEVILVVDGCALPCCACLPQAGLTVSCISQGRCALLSLQSEHA